MPLRTIVDQIGPGGPSKTTLLRHRDHIASTIAQQTVERDTVRTGTLLEDVKVAEGRAERLYQQAEEILKAALADQDRRTALQAVRAAVDVMGEARGYLELRGELTNELGRDRNTGPIAIQIICPSTPVGGQPPRVSYTAIPDSIGFEEIGIVQR